jgi:hypothetical protein
VDLEIVKEGGKLVDICALELGIRAHMLRRLVLAMSVVVSDLTADPAKARSTLHARHMIAPFILLNWPLAVWAVLCVEFKPVVGFLKVFDGLCFPLLYFFTACWLMGFAWAPRACEIPTFAAYGCLGAVSLHDKLTATTRASLPKRVCFNKQVNPEHLEFLQDRARYDLLQPVWIHDHFRALVLHSLDRVSLPVVDLNFDIVHPAMSAKPMNTFQSEHI